MIRSMTGFGRGEYQEAGKNFIVEIHSVNHRYSDLSVKMPRQLSFLEEKIKENIGRAFSRGKIDIYITLDDRSENSKAVRIDEPLAKAYTKSIKQLMTNLELGDDISVSLISGFPEVLKVEKNVEDEDTIWSMLEKALSAAIDNLVKMREREGAKLLENIIEKTGLIKDYLMQIEKRAPEVVKEYKKKLETRIKELLDQQVVDEGRLATEVAFFADRCSIDEEIVRLGSHIGQLNDTLKIDQPVGRKLDFLVQEMNREINTIGSKANDIHITKSVLEVKSEIEKIREQIQNIE